MVKDDVAKAKIVNRGTVEGSGIYSCTATNHAEEPFSCPSTDVKAIREHERQYKHYLQGSALCAICNESVNLYTNLTLASNKPIHKECLPNPEDEL